MLNLERAKKEVASILSDVEQVLSEDVQQDPVSHLPELAFAEELLQKAKRVFPKANIVGYSQPDIEGMRDTLDKMDQQLAQHGLLLLDRVLKETVDLQQRIDDMGDQATGAQLDYSAKKLFPYWSKEYNRQIDACCIDSLLRISALIDKSPYVEEEDMVALIETLKPRLSASFKEREKLQQLQLQVATIKQSLLQVQPGMIADPG